MLLAGRGQFGHEFQGKRQRQNWLTVDLVIEEISLQFGIERDIGLEGIRRKPVNDSLRQQRCFDLDDLALRRDPIGRVDPGTGYRI